MTITSVRFLLALVAITALACTPGLAQTISGELVGTVYDASGATIPGATITATNAATGVSTSAESTVTGQYRIPNLPVGTYNLTVTAKGFAEAKLANVSVDLNKTATANITLQVGQTTVTLEVSEAAAVIDTTTAQVQSTFDARQMADLPTASTGSGVINLSLLVAGVSSSGTAGVGTGPSVGGQRARNNNFTVEGVDNNSKSVTGPIVTVPNDAVAEFTLLANQFAPEFGHSSGGQFNQVVKSGTNDFHGSVYEYLQNRNLDAADQINVVNGTPLHPRYDNNRLGGTFGGPIKKNKLFFFADYEYNPYGAAGSAGQIFAPTAAGYSALAGVSGLSQTNLSILKQYLPAAATAVDPSATPNGAYPVVNGITIPLGQLPVSTPNYSNTWSVVGSVDYNITDRDQLRGRYLENHFSGLDTGAQLPVFYVPLPNKNYLATFSEFHNFTPSLNNEFRLGYNRNYNIYGVGPQKFPGLDAFPNITVDELNINIGPDPNAPQGGVQNTYQGTDNVSYIKGAHTLKFGVDFKKLIAPQVFTQRARGDYEWSSLALYLQDSYPDGIGERSLGNFIYYGDQTQFGSYINDDWKIKPNFTVNMGVRYERTTLPYAERLQKVNAISDVPGLITFGEPKPQNLNFEPRIGFAWSPGKTANTSIRAGFGMTYDQLFDNLGLLSMPPQFQTTVDVGGLAGSNFLANGGIKPGTSGGTLSQADARALTASYIPNQKLPRAISWNLGVQHVFKENYTVEVRYLGTRGVFLPVQDRLNVQNTVTPQTALPLFMTAPSQATLDGLTSSLEALTDQFNNGNNGVGGMIIPAFANAGFQSYVVGFMPRGNSTYHGLATQVTRRFNRGLQFVGSYTFSHNIDDSTAEVFSTVTTPRRPEDFQNLSIERSSSALDHRQRFTMAVVYELPFFKNAKWFMKNIVGNWEIAPVYTYQTGTLGTVQSARDANLNGDSWTDRVFVNPAGTVNIGSSVSPLTNSNGDTVAYVVDNPNARYIRAGSGQLPNGGRNTEHFMPIDDIDMSLLKRVNITERFKLELGGRFFNIFNHPQYVGGYINDVAPIGYTSTEVRNFLNPASTTFYHPDYVFSSNPRSIQVSARFVF